MPGAMKMRGSHHSYGGAHRSTSLGRIAKTSNISALAFIEARKDRHCRCMSGGSLGRIGRGVTAIVITECASHAIGVKPAMNMNLSQAGVRRAPF